MISSVLTHLTNVPVTLKRGTVTFPFLVSEISVVHRYDETVVAGNPEDFVQRNWRGGTVSFSGIFTYASTSDSWLVVHYFDSMTIGTEMTLIGIRPALISLEMSALGEGVKSYGGACSFTFSTFV